MRDTLISEGGMCLFSSWQEYSNKKYGYLKIAIIILAKSFTSSTFSHVDNLGWQDKWYYLSSKAMIIYYLKLSNDEIIFIKLHLSIKKTNRGISQNIP